MKKYLTFIVFIVVALFLLYGEEMGLLPPADDGPLPSGILKVHFIDVGQGDAILVQTAAGQSMLIDAGENNQGGEVINYLKSQGVKELDIVVGTHPHSDHIGGLDTVVNNLPVKKVYLPKVTHTSKTFRDLLQAVKDSGLKVSTAQAGIELPLDGIKAAFVAPVADSYDSLNNYSAVIKLDYGSQSFLLTGDAETQSEDQILDSGANIRATVLKVGHHGSSTSTSLEFLQAVRPQYAVIMLGEDNPYGHPHAEILERLQEAGIEIYRTDRDGTIVFSTDGKDIDIH